MPKGKAPRSTTGQAKDPQPNAPPPNAPAPEDAPTDETRRTIKRDPKTTQLLERGETPTADELIDPEVASPSETTVEGGPGTDAAYREGGPMRGLDEPENDRAGGTGGEGGYSTLGGGVYQDEGDPEDASHS